MTINEYTLILAALCMLGWLVPSRPERTTPGRQGGRFTHGEQ